MASFEPGHLHIHREPLQPGDFGYDIKIDYQVVQDPKEGKSMQFDMHGQINGKDFKESFTLPKDMAFDFARVAFKIAVKKGIPNNANILSMHKYYDLMFKDVREQLDVKPGDPVKPEHLE
ncbi:DUF5064 family protein [Pseudomonas helleri]|uniref:DUF5064 family protein n=1 Tax=Pseudomonas helleri TaxID=1608996 RepID=UPI003F99700F